MPPQCKIWLTTLSKRTVVVWTGIGRVGVTESCLYLEMGEIIFALRKTIAALKSKRANLSPFTKGCRDRGALMRLNQFFPGLLAPTFGALVQRWFGGRRAGATVGQRWCVINSLTTLVCDFGWLAQRWPEGQRSHLRKASLIAILPVSQGCFSTRKQKNAIST